MNVIKYIAFMLVAATIVRGQSPLPLPIDAQVKTVPNLATWQANAVTYRATFRNGGVPESLAGLTPFLYWSPYGITNSTTVTANYTVVQSSSGIVDFAFSPGDLNYATGAYVYSIGLSGASGPRVFRQGSLTINASQASIGADPLVVTTNFFQWWQILGVPDFATNTPLYEIDLTPYATTSALALKLDTSIHASSTGAIWYAIGGLDAIVSVAPTGNPLYEIDLTPYATTNEVATKLPTTTHASSTSAIWLAIGSIVSAENALTSVVATGTTRLTATNASGQATVNLDVTGLSSSTIYQVSGGTGISVSQSSGPIAVVSVDSTVATTAGVASAISAATGDLVSTGDLATALTPYATESYVTGVVADATGDLVSTGDLASAISSGDLVTTGDLASAISTAVAPLADTNFVIAAVAAVPVGVTNIGAHLTGNGQDTPLAVDIGFLDDYTPLATYTAGVASLTAFMPGAAISNEFLSTSTAASVYYRASNPSGYVSSASGWSGFAATQVVSFGNGHIGTVDGNLFLSNNLSNARIAINDDGSVDVYAPAGFSTEGELYSFSGFFGELFDAGGNRSSYYRNYANITNTASLVTTQSLHTTTTQLQASVSVNTASITTLQGRATVLEGYTNRAANAANSNIVYTSAFATNFTPLTIYIVNTAAQAVVNTTLSTGKVSIVDFATRYHAIAATNISESYLLSNTRTNPIIVGTYTNTAFANSAFIAGPSSNYSGVISRRYTAVARSKAGGTSELVRHIQWSHHVGSWQDVSGDESTTNTILTTGNFSPAGFVTLAAANTNFFKRTTAPTNSFAYGEYNQVAIATNFVYFYNHILERWIRITGSLDF